MQVIKRDYRKIWDNTFNHVFGLDEHFSGRTGANLPLDEFNHGLEKGWEGGGFGPRALDLTCLLFEWERLRLADAPGLSPDGSERILARFAAAGGDAALRLTVAYRAVAVMGVTATRGEHEWFDRWTRTAAAVLARLGV